MPPLRPCWSNSITPLSAEGPFTVFAPTNAAFEALFATLEVNGVEDLDVETLTAVLLSHVVEGNVVAADVSSGSVPTLNAEKQLFNMVVCAKRFKFVPLF